MITSPIEAPVDQSPDWQEESLVVEVPIGKEFDVELRYKNGLLDDVRIMNMCVSGSWGVGIRASLCGVFRHDTFIDPATNLRDGVTIGGVRIVAGVNFNLIVTHPIQATTTFRDIKI